MGLLDSVLGGVLGQLGGGQHGEQAGGGLNPKMMMALGLLAMMAMRHKGQEADGGVASAGADAGAGGLGGLGGLGGVLGGLRLGGNWDCSCCWRPCGRKPSGLGIMVW